jgi:hypothetical protein
VDVSSCSNEEMCFASLRSECAKFQTENNPTRYFEASHSTVATDPVGLPQCNEGRGDSSYDSISLF